MGVRQIRSENDIKPGKPLPVVCQNGSETDKERIERNRGLLHSLARLERIDWLDGEPDSPDFATALVGEMKLLIPMAGLIDKQAELERLQKNIEKNEQDLQRISAKLGNENFVSRAPAEVVDKEKAKLADTESTLASLRAQLQRIESI
jgi:valyl-tRNA synthetase